MKILRHFPLAALIAGLNTAIGRMICVALAVSVGAVLGFVFHAHKIPKFSELGEFIFSDMPYVLMASALTPTGIITLYPMLLFTYVWSRYNWPLWLVLLFTIMTCWNIYSTLNLIDSVLGGRGSIL